MPTVQVSGIQVVAVYVSDLAKARTFFSEQLGFQVSEEMPPGVLMKAGEVTLYLEGGRKKKSAAQAKLAEVSVCLALKDLGVRAAYEKLRAAGVSVRQEYTEFAPSFAMFRVADPDGNVLEFAGAP